MNAFCSQMVNLAFRDINLTVYLLSDIFCGQIQCSSREAKPGIADYGKAYKKIDIGNKQHCR